MSATGLPLIDALTATVRHNGFRFSKDTRLIAVQHLVPDTLATIRACIALNLSPENIFLLGKVYSNVPDVITSLKRLGVHVAVTTQPPPGEYDLTFERDITLLWEWFCYNLKDVEDTDILILDDGGMLISKTPATVVACNRVIGVEQTTPLCQYSLGHSRPEFTVECEGGRNNYDVSISNRNFQ